MGKKKKGKGIQPTKNKFWSNIRQVQNIQTRNVGQIPPSTVESFQAPHHQPDSMMDLTDDTSPNIPMSKAGNAGPQGAVNKGPQMAQQATQSKSPIVLGLSAATQNRTEDKQMPGNPGKSVPNVPQKAVVEGVASVIKLFNSKAVSVDKDQPASSPPVTAGSSNAVTVQDTKTANVPNPVHVSTSSGQSAPANAGTQDAKTVNLPKPVFVSSGRVITGKTIDTRVTGLTPMKKAPPKPPATQQYKSQPRIPDIYSYSYPKGIPKSFLPNPRAPAVNPFAAMIQNISDQQNQAWAQQANMAQQQNLAPTFAPTFAPANANAANYGYDPGPVSPLEPMYVDTGTPAFIEQQAYSPSDVYDDNVVGNAEDEPRAGSESPDLLEPGQKRLSAFRRLGPLTQPKKPKMTINLLCNKDQSVREVVDETEQKYVPVHLREDIINSKDETVAKYLKFWPWEKGLPVRKTVMARASKTVMILEHEQMEDVYDKNYLFIQMSVQGYPRDWTKEKLLDTLLDAVNGKSFVPSFIEFAPQECKFLVIRCRAALNAIHKAGFVICKDGVELTIAISQTELTTTKVDFIPKLILKKRLSMGYDGERSLDLSAFTAKEDISHFIYYPLSRPNNQMDLIQVKSTIVWNYLTELNLSHNKLTTIDGFNLPSTTPKLRHLDLSYNCIERATLLLLIRELILHSLKLEGNPLCHDYIDPGHYVKVLKMMFPALTEIDGRPIQLTGEMPEFNRNYCPEAAKGVIDRFLEVYFPLLDAPDKDRAAIKDLYHERASMTITYRYHLRYGPIYRQFRTIFNHSRVLEEGDTDSIEGAAEIARLVGKWPGFKHDPYTFTVDVMVHDDFLTIFKVTGVMKLTSDSLAEDEHLICFSRTFVLTSQDGVEYKIANEMVYWDQPTQEYANTAFQITTVRPKRLSLKMESPPDEDLKEKLIEILMQLTDLNRSASERCLVHRDWNLKTALEYFMKLVKLDEIEILSKEI